MPAPLPYRARLGLSLIVAQPNILCKRHTLQLLTLLWRDSQGLCKVLTIMVT
jgi:hypothetical protein